MLKEIQRKLQQNFLHFFIFWSQHSILVVNNLVISDRSISRSIPSRLSLGLSPLILIPSVNLVEILVDIRNNGAGFPYNVSFDGNGCPESGVPGAHTCNTLPFKSLLPFLHFLEVFAFFVLGKNKTRWETAENLIKYLQEVQKHVF